MSMTTVVEKTAGVVLAGGRSSRMGSPKAALDWHGSTLLRRTVSVVARAVTGPVLVVRAPGQPLPDLPPEVEVAADPREGLGPLQGIAVGLAALIGPGRCRVRLLHRPALPASGLHRRRPRCADPGARRGAAGRPRLSRSRWPPPTAPASLRWSPRSSPPTASAPPSSSTSAGCSASTTPRCGPTRPSPHSTPGSTRWSTSTSRSEYEQARNSPPPEVTVQCFGAVANRAGAGPRTVRAATLAGAAAAVSVPLDHHVVAALNGEQITRDRPPAARRRRHGGVPLGGRRGVTGGARRLLRSSARRRSWTTAAPRCSSCPSRCCAPTSAAPGSARG